MKKFLVALVAVVLIAGCTGQPGITLNGNEMSDKGFDVTVSPVTNNIVSGTVTVRINSVPVGAGKVSVLVERPDGGLALLSRYFEDGSKEMALDTTQMPDGTYNITVSAEYASASPPGPWLARNTLQVTVKNGG
jgi:hypothetical protein